MTDLNHSSNNPQWQWRDGSSGSGYMQAVHHTTQPPLDIPTIRDTISTTLNGTPSTAELDTLLCLLRGHVALLIVEVEGLATPAHTTRTVATVATAELAISDARRKLHDSYTRGLASARQHAPRLARCARALLTHHHTLSETQAP
ncbi:DUF6415 family natural product biosynthesis protein [Streptomyces sp. NPDC127051]|uniref:DUF6415 family natural product biosynthesis protein n=1 Tax=Streptomyces sp. NPDC127051 TaxID=3347119 RepID=UPI003662CEBC